jgi:hypothetical protein
MGGDCRGVPDWSREIGCCAFVVLYDEKMVYRYNTVYPYYWQCKKIK